MRSLVRFTMAFSLFCMPSIAFAHTGAEAIGSFFHGFVHPLSGLDHVIAMVLVGLYAVQVGGKATWLIPGTFVLLMALGALFGHLGLQVPFVETGIAVSVVALGLAVAFAIKLPTTLIASLAGLFALFHGYTHGAEMPGATASGTYALGFLVATVLLHGVGMVLGTSTKTTLAVVRGVQSTGALAACAGVAMLAGVI